MTEVDTLNGRDRRGHLANQGRLIVHADDFGESVEITRGICEAIEAGAVTSTSIMANMPGTRDALPRVAALAGRASFGVHLNFCEGRPLTAGRTLVNAEGTFHRKRELFLRSITSRLSSLELEAEISAQIACVRDAGIRISHVDGHKHLHQLPVVSAAVARVLPRFGIERVRIARLGSLTASPRPATFVRETLAWQAARAFRGSRLRSPKRVVDLQTLMAPGAVVDHGALLRDAGGAVEMFCHPGTALADVEKPGSCERFAELSYLTSDRYRELIMRSGVQLSTYWDI